MSHKKDRLMGGLFESNSQTIQHLVKKAELPRSQTQLILRYRPVHHAWLP